MGSNECVDTFVSGHTHNWVPDKKRLTLFCLFDTWPKTCHVDNGSFGLGASRISTHLSEYRFNFVQNSALKRL